MRLSQLPPLTGSFQFRHWLREARRGSRAERLRATLAEFTGAREISLHASGREALRAALSALPRRAGSESEVLLPAYTCFSVAASAVAAGLRVRLVDVDADGRIDRQSFADQPLDRVSALVVTNLFGLPEPVAHLRSRCATVGIPLIDDAAQSFGAADPDGFVGSRGALGLLSFSRGKPLAGLGGGAIAWMHESPPGRVIEADTGSGVVTAFAMGLALEVARLPWVFRWLAAVPGMEIGETPFDPGFARGGLQPALAFGAMANLDHHRNAASVRRERALALGGALAAESGFRPLLESPERRGVYPRLAVVAPDRATRDRALHELQSLGASRFYPHSLARVPGLKRYLVGDCDTPRADQLAERLMTLPVHEWVGARQRASMLQKLRDLVPA